MRSQDEEMYYSCSVCGKDYGSRSGLRNHMNIHAEKYKCANCEKFFQTGRDLERHGLTHSGEKSLECNVCKKLFARSSQLTSHLKIHTDNKPYQCHVCEKAFREVGNLRRHMRLHTGERPFTCTECGRGFIESGSLSKHTRTKHTADASERSHVCDRCGKQLASGHSLKQHLATRHSQIKPFLCCVCDKRYSTHHALKLHEALHSDRVFGCPYCGKQFKMKGGLEQHVRSHTGAKPHSCKQCSRCFTRLDQLKRHLLVSHGEGSWFTCDICPKKFVFRQSLEQHVRGHEGVKPYVCSECPKRFCTLSDFRRHQYQVHRDVVDHSDGGTSQNVKRYVSGSKRRRRRD